MSSLSGASDGPWSLRRAVDALAQAARAAGRPGLIWIAGLGYPAMGAGLGFSVGEGSAREASLPLDPSGGMGSEEFYGWLLTLGFAALPLLFVFLRLRVGLARIAPPAVWERLRATFGRVRLRQAWRAGSGLTLATLGISLLLWLMILLVALGLGLPVSYAIRASKALFGETGEALLTVGLALPAVALLSAYSMTLAVLQQLALQSLAHNRRGVNSALLHAWRIARQDPWATGRTLAVDLLLNVTVFVLALVATSALRVLSLEPLAVVLVQLPLFAFLGVTRAAYWARAYRALGGLSPDDKVPGLREGAPELA